MICSSVNLDFFMPDLPSEIGLYSPRRGTENWEQVSSPELNPRPGSAAAMSAGSDCIDNSYTYHYHLCI
ncbi:MAG: hypothetical protein NAOJABEB_01142 [Steroidobacteraceae bacterium]|nr:hypothetical protein [Steroidobacteraceae bacterium]